MKRKVSALFLGAVLLLSSACTTSQAPVGASPQKAPQTAVGAAKTGIGVITSIEKSQNAAAQEGIAQTDSLAAAVLVGTDGKILQCTIDSAQTKINFTKEGKISTDLKTQFASKNDLGEAYGMKKASGIQKEWNEQAAAFSKYVTGKTMEEVKGMALNEEGRPAQEELKSSVTVHVGDFIGAIEKAVANAQELGASAGDKLGMQVSTTIDKSSDASEKEGLAQAYTNYLVSTVDEQGKISSAIVEASQTNINFLKDGTITTKKDAPFQTKLEAGDSYGMKKVSKIGKEWYEQANAFAKYVSGKTIEQVKGMQLTEAGQPAEEELKSSVTIHVGDYISQLEEAVKKAR